MHTMITHNILLFEIKVKAISMRNLLATYKIEISIKWICHGPIGLKTLPNVILNLRFQIRTWKIKVLLIFIPIIKNHEIKVYYLHIIQIKKVRTTTNLWACQDKLRGISHETHICKSLELNLENKNHMKMISPCQIFLHLRKCMLNCGLKWNN